MKMKNYETFERMCSLLQIDPHDLYTDHMWGRCPYANRHWHQARQLSLDVVAHLHSYSTEDECLQLLVLEILGLGFWCVCFLKRRVSSDKRTPCTVLCQGKHSRCYVLFLTKTTFVGFMQLRSQSTEFVNGTAPSWQDEFRDELLFLDSPRVLFVYSQHAVRLKHWWDGFHRFLQCTTRC